MPKNEIHVEIPQEKAQQLLEKINELRELMEPYLTSLTKEERSSLPKMKDKTQPFVSKTVDYVKTNPKMIPPMMNAAAMKKDFDLYQSLSPIYGILLQLESNLSDTLLLAGHEAYKQALLYYASVKMSAKMGDPDAKSIQEDLGKRFSAQGKRPKKTNSTEIDDKKEL